MKRLPPRPSIVLLLALAIAATATNAAAGAVAEMEVDARDLPRKLVSASITWRVGPGEQVFLYPRWIPGTHSPGGPVQNLGGLAFETADGKPIPWRRDETDPHRFTCTVPPGSARVVVRTRYICNQPTANSRGADSYGTALLGILNWNTVFLYPEGTRTADAKVAVTLRLPDGWRHASALVVSDDKPSADPRALRFDPVSLERLVDSPLIAGRHVRAFPLTDAGAAAPHVLHVVAASEEALQLPEAILARYRRVVAEAGVMFGRYPHDGYHFLLTLSDEIGNLGLEHLRCSLNGVKERALADPEDIEPWVAYLLPHEYAHSWCGKWRRPRAMVTPDFQVPERTSLLWIYEGLAQYLGDVLAARAGLVSPDDYRASLAQSISGLMHQKGRRWRPLGDTAASSWLLREGSPSWGLHRRSQDYYAEGALIWMEVDARIRRETNETRSLDDFCRSFLGASGPAGEVLPHDLADVVAALGAILPADWEGFFRERVDRTQDELPVAFVSSLGHRLQYAPERSAPLKKREDRGKSRDFRDAIGCAFSEAGIVSRVVPDSPADRAGLFDGVEVLGVNDRRFSLQRIEDAIAQSVAARSVRLLIASGDVLREVTVPYGDGLKYLSLARDAGQPDRLTSIITSRASAPKN